MSFAGLDLQTVDGTAEARRRVERAIKALCEQLRDDHDLSHRETYLDCIDKTSVQLKPHLDAFIARAQTIRTAAVK